MRVLGRSVCHTPPDVSALHTNSLAQRARLAGSCRKHAHRVSPCSLHTASPRVSRATPVLRYSTNKQSPACKRSRLSPGTPLSCHGGIVVPPLAQVLRYNESQAYVVHYDYLESAEGHDFKSEGLGTNRFATVSSTVMDFSAALVWRACLSLAF